MVGKWYVVEYLESGRLEYVDSIERVGELVGLTPLSVKTYLSRGEHATPRQVVHPETRAVELTTFAAVDMTEPLPDEVKELIAARA